MTRAFLTALALICAAGPAPAESRLTALARVEAEGSGVFDARGGPEIALSLTRPVPWRVFLLDAPPRVVLDLSEAIWPEGLELESAAVTAIETGTAGGGWSRLVVTLARHMAIAEADMETGRADGGADLRLRLAPASEEAFAAAAGPPPGALPEPSRNRLDEGANPVVVIDPGHGGRDPGAEAAGLAEADLMLSVARELREALFRTGDVEVVLTRDDDSFVALGTRIERARAAGGDLFVSLHADAVTEGATDARGATIYTLAEGASDAASRALVERHETGDLLSGVDLAPGAGDAVALVLMDIARRETAPRSEALAGAVLLAIDEAGIELAGRPLRTAGFSVLKAPDMPSVLVELGFLSSETDRRRLTDPVWRAAAVDALAGAIVRWARDDALRKRDLRR